MATGKFCGRGGLKLARRLGLRRGIATVEYAMLLGVMGVSSIAAWQHLGASVQAIVTAASQAFDGLLH